MMKYATYALVIAMVAFACSCSDDMGPDPGPPAAHVQQDTTSHDVVWEVFRFGRPGEGPGLDVSFLHDIYALNDTDVWAVGKIRRIEEEIDSLGLVDWTYNAAHWNGREWEFKNIHYRSYPPGSRYARRRWHEQLYAVWVFAHNDLLVSTLGEGLFWYNENSTKWGYDQYLHEWTYLKYLQEAYPGYGYMTRFWAYSKSDIYSVSWGGPIRRRLDGTWICLGSGPNSWRLNDIHGSESGRLWAGGYMYPEDETAFLSIMGNDAANVEKKEYYGVSPAPGHALYVCGDTLYAYVKNAVLIQSTTDENHFRYTAGRGTWEFSGFIEALRGKGHNNIFAAGYYGTILHYNGKSWKQVAPTSRDNGLRFKAISISENYAFIAGYDYNNGQAVVYRCRLPQ